MKIKYLLFSLALVGLLACKEDPEPTSCDGNGGSTEFDRAPMLTNAAKKYGTGLYVPSGALWGGEDIRKMSDLGTLKVAITSLLPIYILH